MKAKKLYKPNVVYVVEIHGCLYYAGCHCSKKKNGFTECDILFYSGNPLMKAYKKKLITYQEYRECCNLVHVEDYNTKEEALNREAELIQKFKEHYGSQCLNKSDGNIFGGTMGFSPTKNTKKKLSDSNRNNPKHNCKPVRQYYLDGQFKAEYPSISEAQRQTGIAFSSISSVAFETPVKDKSGKYYIPKSAGGYLWKSA